MVSDVHRRLTLAAILLAALVAGNFVLRHALEHSHRYVFVFFDEVFPVAAAKFRTGAYPWWQWLLPNPDLGGSWSSATLVAANWLEMKLGAPATWELLNVLVVAVSFLTGLAAFGSLAFAGTFAIAVGFGTQLYQAYATSGPVGLNLLIVYYELLLLCCTRAITAARSRPWQVAVVVMGIVTALAYEGWLDFLVFVWIATPIVAVAAWRFGRPDRLPRIAFVAAVLTAIGAVYVVIKIKTGYGQVPGAESDVVFNYPALSPAVEDVLSNGLTHLYTVVTGFLPPIAMSSTALYSLGPARLVDLQFNYHHDFSYLVPMHYLFLWRYYAGALAVVFAYALVRTGKKAWRDRSADALALTIFLIMMAVGGPTHAMIKFRPMKSAPILGYQVLVGVLGGALAIAYVVMMARRDIRNGRSSAILVAAVWIFLLYGSLTRPAMMGHLAAQVGLGEGLYPDPWRATAALLHIDTRSAPGLAEYRLEPVASHPAETAIGLAAEGAAWLPELSQPLPDWSKWSPESGVRVSRTRDAFHVVGDTSQFLYQLSSPLIVVRPHTQVRVRVRLRVAQGRVCLGALDRRAERWVLTPDEFRQEYAFDTGDNDALALVIANCNMRHTDNDRTIFDAIGGSFSVQP